MDARELNENYLRKSSFEIEDIEDEKDMCKYTKKNIRHILEDPVYRGRIQSHTQFCDSCFEILENYYHIYLKDLDDKNVKNIKDFIEKNKEKTSQDRIDELNERYEKENIDMFVNMFSEIFGDEEEDEDSTGMASTWTEEAPSKEERSPMQVDPKGLYDDVNEWAPNMFSKNYLKKKSTYDEYEGHLDKWLDKMYDWKDKMYEGDKYNLHDIKQIGDYIGLTSVSCCASCKYSGKYMEDLTCERFRKEAENDLSTSPNYICRYYESY